MTKQLQAGYVCHRCEMGKSVMVNVRNRHQNETIEAYLNYCVEECAKEHRKRTPFCSTQKVDIMLPITQEGVGFPGEDLTEQDKQELKEMLSKPPPVG